MRNFRLCPPSKAIWALSVRFKGRFLGGRKDWLVGLGATGLVR